MPSTPPSPPTLPPPFQHRRALHVPFFPATAPPPSPSQPPSFSPFPKYPSITIPHQPFFPFDPSSSSSSSSPPPPSSSSSSSSSSASSSASSSSQPTFPANISSLVFPNSHSAPAHRHHSKLLPAVLLPLLAVALLAAAALFVVLRRRRSRLSDKFDARSDSHRLVPPEATTSDGSARPNPAPAPASDFLYVGIFANSRLGSSGREGRPSVDSASGSPYQKLSSPELRPLPPLSRQPPGGRGNAEGGAGGASSEEEFYSPREPSVEKVALGGSTGGGRMASFRKMMFPQAVLEKLGSRSSTLSTPSYPSSPTASSPQVGSSPGHSSRRSLKSRSARSFLGSIGFVAPPPPPPLPLRPLTPSPPKRKPASPSPTSSPVDKASDPKVASSGFPSTNETSCRNPFVDCPPLAPHQRQPPPPPPPPPAGYWESQVRKPHAITLPVLVPPKPTAETSAFSYTQDSTGNPVPEAFDRNEETPRPKLKPLHWDKVRASSDRAMVWDQLKSSSFQVNEEMIETLFVCNTTSTATKEMKKPMPPSPNQENRVLDPKKSQNIAILLRALNVTKDEVCEALLEGNADSLGTELLETLLKMAPTKEEEHKLKECKDDSPIKLGTAEKFLKALLDIPFAFKRVDALLYMANFDSEVNYLKRSFETLEVACEELRNSRLFLKLLEAVLKTGNRMNVGTNRGDAHAFKLDTLLKLVDVKGTDGKTTLLHFVVQEIIRAEGSRIPSANAQGNNLQDDLECKKIGLQVVGGLGGELSNVKKAAAMDSDVLSSYVSKLAGGIEKIMEVLRLNESLGSKETDQRFCNAMTGFLKMAEEAIIKVQAQESLALSLVKEITEYFHGDSAREEAHPFRIFMVVRDFLAILDRVCKEVGRINDRTTVSSGQHFPVPVNPTQPPLFPRFHRTGSSDEESQLSS